MDHPRPGVRLTPRLIPFPMSISDSARAALARAVGDDGIPLNATHDLPDPTDHEAWAALKLAANARYAATLSGMAGQVRSTVESVTVGDGIVHVASPATPSERAIIDLHGGGFVFGSGEACVLGARSQADQHGVRCYGIDYRTPPEHPYPAALEDCLSCYRFVLDQHQAQDIVVVGRSAGGNLALSMLMKARNEGLPLPAGVVLLSPQADLTESGDSFAVNEMVDVVLPKSLMPGNLLYADGADLSDPYLSPLHGDLQGLPPTFVQTGTRDLFLSNSVRLHRALLRAEVPVELHVFEAMPHGGFGGATPEDLELRSEIERFVAERWGQSNPPRTRSHGDGEENAND
jgi:epsilon-lactone hydrolase